MTHFSADIANQLTLAAAKAPRTEEAQLMLKAAEEIEWLREAIRRLADQDATLSVCDGNVTVTMDATLTDAEREAVVVPATVLPGNFAGVKWNACCRQYRKALDNAGIKWISEASPEPETIHDAVPAAIAPTDASPLPDCGQVTAGMGTGNTQQPVAWIAVFDGHDADGEFVWPDRDRAMEWAARLRARQGVTIAPLYLQPQPTLTDAERRAVEQAADFIDAKSYASADTLRGLLARTK